MPHFHLSFQYARFSHDQVDDRGRVSRESVEEALDSFDWEGEVALANQLEKCSPTISVALPDDSGSIWISGYGDPTQPQFISDCAAPPTEKPILMGLFRRKFTPSANSQTLTLDRANAAVRALLDGDFELMLEIVREG